MALQQIHRRGCTLGNITSNNVFVSEDGDFELLDIRNNLTLGEDILNICSLLRPMAVTTQLKDIVTWFDEADIDANLEELRSLLNTLVSGEAIAGPGLDDHGVPIGQLQSRELDLQAGHPDRSARFERRRERELGAVALGPDPDTDLGEAFIHPTSREGCLRRSIS